jgi:acetoin utilization deacetylase AcuC-like enzyme
MIIDLDAHQGNGHEKDFANDGMPSILFFSAFYVHNDDTRISIFRLQEGFTFWTCTMLEFIPS